MISNGIKMTEIDKIVDLINTRQEEVKQQYSNQIVMSQNAIAGAQTRIKAYQAEMDALNALENKKGEKLSKSGFMETTGMFLNELNPFEKNSTQANEKKLSKLNSNLKQNQKIIEDNKKLMEQAQDSLRQLSITDGLSSSIGGGGSGGGSSSSKDNLQSLIDEILSAAEAQEKLNNAIQRGIDSQEAEINLHIESAMTIDEYTKGLEQQLNLTNSLEEKQIGLHKEADLYRIALIKLEQAQSQCDTSTEKGIESYNKIGDEIENVKNKVADLGKEYVSTEAKQRSLYSNNIEKIMSCGKRMELSDQNLK